MAILLLKLYPVAIGPVSFSTAMLATIVPVILMLASICLFYKI